MTVSGTALAEASADSHGAADAAAEAKLAMAEPTGDCPQPPAALAAALSAREARLAVQEASALRTARQRWLLADQAIGQRLAELQAAEEELRETLTLADGAAEEDIWRV